MKIFQIMHRYDPYISYFEEKYDIDNLNPDYKTLLNLLINDGFCAAHILKPIFDDSQDAFYTMWNYDRLQHLWAKEHNLKETDSLKILFEQIKTFQPDVIYNCSPQLIDIKLFEPLRPHTKIVTWNADPVSIYDKSLEEYDALLTSSINKINEISNGHLHFPAKDKFADIETKDKVYDIFFYGQYDGDYFATRREYINELIPFFEKNNIKYKFNIMYTQKHKIKYNIPFIRRFDFAKIFSPPKHIANKLRDQGTIFGKDIYESVAKSKIVFNISAETKNFADFKFNMRIFETLGAGGFMLSDKGIYPEHIVDGKDFISYNDISDLKKKILYYLKNDQEREVIAKNGKETISTYYSKEKQWENFQNIIKKL